MQIQLSKKDLSFCSTLVRAAFRISSFSDFVLKLGLGVTKKCGYVQLAKTAFWKPGREFSKSIGRGGFFC